MFLSRRLEGTAMCQKREGTEERAPAGLVSDAKSAGSERKTFVNFCLLRGSGIWFIMSPSRTRRTQPWSFWSSGSGPAGRCFPAGS